MNIFDEVKIFKPQQSEIKDLDNFVMVENDKYKVKNPVTLNGSANKEDYIYTIPGSESYSGTWRRDKNCVKDFVKIFYYETYRYHSVNRHDLIRWRDVIEMNINTQVANFLYKHKINVSLLGPYLKEQIVRWINKENAKTLHKLGFNFEEIYLQSGMAYNIFLFTIKDLNSQDANGRTFFDKISLKELENVIAYRPDLEISDRSVQNITDSIKLVKNNDILKAIGNITKAQEAFFKLETLFKAGKISLTYLQIAELEYCWRNTSEIREFLNQNPHFGVYNFSTKMPDVFINFMQEYEKQNPAKAEETKQKILGQEKQPTINQTTKEKMQDDIDKIFNQAKEDVLER